MKVIYFVLSVVVMIRYALGEAFVDDPLLVLNEENHACMNYSDCENIDLKKEESRRDRLLLDCPAGSLCSGGNITPCPRGSYCVDGIEYLCPGGTYGSTTGLFDDSCSGICPAGYYCPEGSSDPYEFPCGGSYRYCPEGSSTYSLVSSGYYSTPETVDTSFRSGQSECEPGFYCHSGVRSGCSAGTYGDRYGETSNSCSGLCYEGYYCPAGSTNTTMKRCGSARYYCPEGSENKKRVSSGYYSGPLSTSSEYRFQQNLCEIGHYCVNGIRHECPGGTYGNTTGLSSQACSGTCREGVIQDGTGYTNEECGGMK